MAENQDSKEPQKPLFKEIATTGDGRDITQNFIGELIEPTDPRLRRISALHDAYEKVLRDDQVKSTLQQRRLAVISRGWEVTPGGESPADKQAAEFIEAQLDQVGWDRVCEKMLFGVFYGYAVAECMWAMDGGRVTLDAIRVRRARRFRFDQDFRLRLLTREKPNGEIMPLRKFWNFSTGTDNDDDPYGLGLGYFLYWPTWFKRNGMKSWLLGLDKFAQPTKLGKYPAGAADSEVKKLLAAMAAVANDTGIAIPEGFSMELLQAARSGTADFDKLYGRMDAAIAKIVLSQTMTTDDGSSLSQAQVHSDVKLDVIKADADLLNESFNCGPVRWLTDWNFPGAAYPIVCRETEEPEDLADAAARDERLSRIGWTPGEERVQEVYGEGYERTTPAAPFGSEPGVAPGAPAPGQPPTFADPDDPADAISRLVDAMGEEWEEVLGPVADELETFFAGATNLEDARDRLAEAIRDLPTDKMQDLLARAGFSARLAGEVGVDIQGEEA